MKYRFTFVALSSILFLFSCNHDRKEIHDVAMGYIASDTPAHFVIDSITVETDTAWVYYTKTTPIKNFSDCIQVIKENGDWLVNVILDLPEMLSTPDTITLQVAPDAKLQKNEN